MLKECAVDLLLWANLPWTRDLLARGTREMTVDVLHGPAELLHPLLVCTSSARCSSAGS